ncbi:hypothetical protein [Pandoraea sputorum]|uniref:hypothetical protein n=1 Tax=Pandoraea sputorum TaxID=93222 RepID=UPI0012431093|nr:hypothetical protein [Pandoraea sputorum]VVE49894.1 hypothetical protein PSP20601_04609 [Pandoraea sputorum]
MNDTKTLKGLDNVLRQLQSLPPEIVSKRGGPVKSGLRKGAVVIRDEWKRRVQAIVDAPNKGDVPTKSLGILKESIIATRNSKPHLIGANEAYRVRIKGKVAYPKYRGKNVTPYGVGSMLERGTERRPPMPWATPGYFTTRDAALAAAVDEMNKRIAAVIRKMRR